MVGVDVVELEWPGQLVRNGTNPALQLANLLERVQQLLGVFRRVAANIPFVDENVS